MLRRPVETAQYSSVDYQSLQMRHPDLNERAQELLRQRDDRDGLQDPQVQAGLAGQLAIPPAG